MKIKTVLSSVIVLFSAQIAQPSDCFWGMFKCFKLSCIEFFSSPVCPSCCSSFIEVDEIEPLLLNAKRYYNKGPCQDALMEVICAAIEKQTDSSTKCMVALAFEKALVPSACVLLEKGVKAQDSEYCLKKFIDCVGTQFSANAQYSAAAKKLLEQFAECKKPYDALITYALEKTCFDFVDILVPFLPVVVTDPDKLLVVMGKCKNSFDAGSLELFSRFIANAVCDSHKNYDLKKMLERAAFYGIYGATQQFLMRGVDFENLPYVFEKMLKKENLIGIAALCVYGGHYMPYRKAEMEFDTESGMLAMYFNYFVNEQSVGQNNSIFEHSAECGTLYKDDFCKGLECAVQKYTSTGSQECLMLFWSYAMRHKEYVKARDVFACMMQQIPDKAPSLFIDFLHDKNYEIVHQVATLSDNVCYTSWLNALKPYEKTCGLARTLYIKAVYQQKLFEMCKRGLTDVQCIYA